MNVDVSETETERMCRTRQQAVCLGIVVYNTYCVGFFFCPVYPTFFCMLPVSLVCSFLMCALMIDLNPSTVLSNAMFGDS